MDKNIFNKFNLLKILILLSLTFISLASADDRTWTSNDGKEIIGKMLREENDSVVLLIKNKEFTIPLSRLSEQDQKWITAKRKETEEQEKEFAILRGTTKTFPKNHQQEVTYHVYYPKSFSISKPCSMIILFSASGQGMSILEKFKAACEELGWIGVACDTFKNGQDNNILDPLFGKLLPIIEKNIPHDPEHLYMGGISGGASRALHYTAKFERPWKGIISCGGWLAKAHDLEYCKGMAIAWVNGDKDENANSWIEKDSAALKLRDCKTKVFHFPSGHEIGPPETLAEAMKWAQEANN
jgi:predicted peptidase